MSELKLIALDADDIEVVSAHLQDAVLKASDIRWRPAEHRVVLGLNRFDWCGADGMTGGFRRCRSVLRFERVLSCKCRNVDGAAKDDALNLLAVAFDHNNPPGGAVTLTFSGGAALRLEVECLEAELADLGPAWSTDSRPIHAVTVEPDEAPKQG